MKFFALWIAFIALSSFCFAKPEERNESTKLEPEEQFFGYFMRFKLDLTVVDSNFVGDEERLAPLYDAVFEKDPRNAAAIANLWHGKARAHLQEFIDKEIERGAKNKVKGNEKALVEAVQTVNFAIQAYYLEHWSEIKRMLEVRVKSLITEEKSQQATDEYLAKFRLLREEHLKTKPESQREMNQDAGQKLAESEKSLQKTYDAILSSYSGSPDTIIAIRNAQRAWMTWRDAEINAIWPETAQQGSVYGMIISLQKAEMAANREKQLKTWLEGFEEGDLGAGARRRK